MYKAVMSAKLEGIKKEDELWSLRDLKDIIQVRWKGLSEVAKEVLKEEDGGVELVPEEERINKREDYYVTEAGAKRVLDKCSGSSEHVKAARAYFRGGSTDMGPLEAAKEREEASKRMKQLKKEMEALESIIEGIRE